MNWFWRSRDTSSQLTVPASYVETKAIKQARRYIELLEKSVYRSLQQDVALAEEKNRQCSEAAATFPDQRDVQLEVFKAKANADIRRRRTRVDFLGQFRPLKRLAEGERGRAWIVEDEILRRRVVMKIYYRKDVDTKDCMNTIHDARGIILGLTHPNICTLQAVFSPRDNCNLFCFVSAYCSGGSLAAVLRDLHPTDRVELPNRIRFRREEEVAGMDKEKIDKIARFVLAEICGGLQYLYSHEICHYNLKPENVLISERGHVQLSDFSISGIVNYVHMQKYYQFIEKHSVHFAEVVSGPQMQIGSWAGQTPTRVDFQGCDRTLNSVALPRVNADDADSSSVYFAPPEFWHCGPINRNRCSADLWALGVMAYMCYCGGNPFQRQCRYANRRSALLQAISHTINFETNPYLTPEFIGKFAPKDAVDLIGKLVTVVEDRLGCSKTNYPVEDHPYFRGVDCSRVHEKQSPITSLLKEEMWLSPKDEKIWRSYVGVVQSREENEEVDAMDTAVDVLDNAAFDIGFTNEVLHYMTV